MKKMSAKLVLLTLLATAGLCVFSYESSWALEATKPGAPAVFNGLEGGPSVLDGVNGIGGEPANSGASSSDTVPLKSIDAAIKAAQAADSAQSGSVPDGFNINKADEAGAATAKYDPIEANAPRAKDLVADGLPEQQAKEVVIDYYLKNGEDFETARALAEESLNAPVTAGSIALKSSGTVNNAQCDAIRAKVLAAAGLREQQMADTVREKTAVGSTAALSCSAISLKAIADSMAKAGNKGGAGGLLGNALNAAKSVTNGQDIKLDLGKIATNALKDGGSVKGVLSGIAGGASGTSCKNTLSDSMKAVTCVSSILGTKGTAAGAAAASCVDTKKIGAFFGAGKPGKIRKEITDRIEKDPGPLKLEKAPSLVIPPLPSITGK